MSTPELIAARRLQYCKNRYCVSDPLSLVNRLFLGSFIRDRFDRLNEGSPFRVLRGIEPQDQEFLDTKDQPVADIKELCDQKAQELVQSGERLYVSWSGGVDSTAVVIALLRAGCTPEQMAIICAPFSQVEYPWFYDFLKKKGFDFTETNKVVAAYNRVTEGKIITGWCADQLFGSNIHLRNATWYDMPWVDGLKAAMDNSGIRLTEHSYEVLEGVFSSYAASLGLELTQFCEFAWLINFGIKFSYVREDTQLAVADAETRARAVPFYAGVDFQRWSYQHYGQLKEINPHLNSKFYKRELKEYIYAYTNEDLYFRKKGKRNSWAVVQENTRSIISVHDTEGYKKLFLKSAYPERCALDRMVADKYLKEEYLD